MTDQFGHKVLYYFSLAVTYCIGFFTPIAPMLTWIMILIICDAITGVRAAQVRGEKISSDKLGRSISKMVFYFIAILLSKGVEEVFFPIIPIVRIVAGFIAVTEFKSNIENISDILGIDIWREIKDKFNYRAARKKKSEKQ